MKKAIIFDVYGTLISTGNGSLDAVKKILHRINLNVSPDDFYSEWKRLNRLYKSSDTFLLEREIFTKSLGDLYKKYNIAFDYKSDVNTMLKTMLDRSLFDDTIVVLEQLSKEFRILIGSTTDDNPLFQNLEYNKLDIIPHDRIYTSERLGCYKPKAEFYQSILDAQDLKFDEVVFVGDSLTDDVYGPRQLGIYTVLVDRKNLFLGNDIKPDKVIQSLLEIRDFIYDI